MTPDGIARRVPGVWVLSFPKYFNCCPFLPNTLNCRPPSGDKLIFISLNGNLLFVTPSQGGGGSLQSSIFSL